MSELVVKKILPVGNALEVIGKIVYLNSDKQSIIDIDPDTGTLSSQDFNLTHNDLNIPVFVLKDPSGFGFGYITDQATFELNKTNPNKGIKFHTVKGTLFNTFTIGNIQGGAGSITITPEDSNFLKPTESVAIKTANFAQYDTSSYSLIQTRNDELYLGKSILPQSSEDPQSSSLHDSWMNVVSTFHPSSSYVTNGVPIKTIFRGGGTYFGSGKHIFKGEVRIGAGTIRMGEDSATIIGTHLSNHTSSILGPNALSAEARGQYSLRAGKASLPEGQTAQYWVNQADLGNLGPDALSNTIEGLGANTPDFWYPFSYYGYTTNPDIDFIYGVPAIYVDITDTTSILNALDTVSPYQYLTSTDPSSPLYLSSNHIGRDNQPNLMSLGSFTLGLNSKADGNATSFFEIISGISDVANHASATKLLEVNNQTQQTFVKHLSSSGDLFASTSYSGGPENEGEETEEQLKVVVVDSTGKFYHTGSYGGNEVPSASYASSSTSASYASSSTSASYASSSTSASYASSSTSASYASSSTSASYASSSTSASYASSSTSASYASSSTSASYAETASYAANALTSYLGLSDTDDTNYIGKDKYIPVVRENNNPSLSTLALVQEVASASHATTAITSTTAMSGGNDSTNFHVPHAIDVIGDAYISGNLSVSGSIGVGESITIVDVTISSSANAFTFGSSSANTINHQMTGNLLITASQGITIANGASTVGFVGTASWAQSASHTVNSSDSISASYASSSTSASYASSSTSASYASSSTSASYASSSTSASHATTASYAINSDGSGFPFSGSAVITGSLEVSHSGIIVSGSGVEAIMPPNAVGFIGTASWAQSSSFALSASHVIGDKVLSASYASSSTSASYASSSTSASYATTASYVDGDIISASYASSSTSASYASSSTSASYATTASHLDGDVISASYASSSTSASYASSSTSASYATTASHADNVSMLFTQLIDVPSSSNAGQNFYPVDPPVGRFALQVNDGGNSLTFVKAVDSSSYASSSTSASFATSASLALTASYASNVATSFIDLTDTLVAGDTLSGKGNYTVVVNNGGTKLILETASLSASYASSSTSASFATTASYSTSASYASSSTSASYASSSTSASYASSSTSASYASSSTSASYASSSTSASYASSSTSASYASSSTSASYALTASFLDTPVLSASYASSSTSASYASSSTSASYAITASHVSGEVISASYASSSTSASYASSSTSASHAITAVSGGASDVEFHVVSHAYVSGNLNVSGAIGVADSVTIADITISQSSDAFIFGSGSTTSINHQMTGNLLITASQGITVNTDANGVGFVGTSSFAQSSSHAITASHVSGDVISASYASSSTSASYASSSTSASYASSSTSASYASSSTSASYASSSTSASYASSSTSASYAITASYVSGEVISASYASSSTSASYASSSTSASYASSSTSASYASSSTSASYASSSTSASYASSSTSASYLNKLTDIGDTPSNYTNSGSFALQVNADGDGVDFVQAVQSASYASSSTSASYAMTSSYALNTEDIPLNFFDLEDAGANVIEDDYPADHVIVANNGNELVFTQTVNSASVAISASHADFVLSASYASSSTSASHADNTISASYALTSSYINLDDGGTIEGTVTSASYASSSTSASYASSSTSASYASSSTSASYASSSTSASYASSSTSASFATTASFALNAEGGVGFPFAGEAIITGSLEVLNIWGESPIQNNLTDNTYLTSSHTLAAGYNLYEAFDNVINDNLSDSAFYQNNVGADHLFIDYDVYGKLGYSPIVNKIGLVFHNVEYSHQKVKVSGSNNGSTWVGIGSEPSLSTETSRSFTFDNTTDFKWYRFTFEKDNFIGDDLSLQEISLYAAEASVTATSFTGSLLGTASYAITASYSLVATSASYATTASHLDGDVLSASYASSSTSASYASSSTSASYASSSTSASYASSSTSASYAATSSYINMSYLELTDTPVGFTASFIPQVNSNNDAIIFTQEVPSASLANTASHALTASFLNAPVLSASYASSSTSASHADHAITASYIDGTVLSASYASSSTSASYASSSTSASYASSSTSASYASSSTSASYALTASSITLDFIVPSASYASSSTSASYASSSTSASHADNAITASLAISGGGVANEFHVVNDLGVIGDINVSGSVAIGAGLTISDVQISSSQNAFTFGTGSANTITHQMTGNLSITASHGISYTGSGVGFHGTASWAQSSSYTVNSGDSVSASYASSSTSASYASSSTSASYASSSTSASYALTASFLDTPVLSASYASSSTSASYASSSTSASYASSSTSASYASSSTSASYASSSTSASYASSSTSASYASSSTSASYATTSSFAITASHINGTVLSASYASSSTSASYASSSTSASFALTASHVEGLDIDDITTTYLELTDTLDTTYVDKNLFVPVVREHPDPAFSTLILTQTVASASHATFADNALTASHVDTTYLDLTDTDYTYNGFAHHVPLVGPTEIGMKFFNTYSLFVESSSQSVNSNFSETASFAYNANSASYALTASYVSGASTSAETAETAECANAAKVHTSPAIKQNLIMIERDDAVGVCAKIYEEDALVWDGEKSFLGISDPDPVTKLDVNGIGFFRGRDFAYTVQGIFGLLGYNDPGIILNGRTGPAMYCETGLHGVSPLARMIKWDVDKMHLIIGEKENDYITDVLIQSGRAGGNILFYPGDGAAGDTGAHVNISKYGYTSIENKLSIGQHQNPSYQLEIVNGQSSITNPSKIRMRSTSTSQYNFDIQQTNDGVKFHINANPLAHRPWVFTTNTDTGDETWATKEHLKLDNSTGNFTIGSSYPSNTITTSNYKLNVNGTLNASVLYVANSFFESDERLKDNIEDLDSQLGVIKKLKPRKFDWKRDQSSDIGFIAQELQKVVPELVTEAPDDEKTLHVNYKGLIPMLVKSMQEQQEMIEKLSARINELEK